MKKILIIMNCDFRVQGGTENYNLMLMDILYKYYQNFEIDLFIIDSPKPPGLPSKYKIKLVYCHTNKTNDTNKSIKYTCSFIENQFTNRREFKKIYKQYDLILNSSLVCFPIAKKLNNYYLIQHNIFRWYVPILIDNKSIRNIIRKFIWLLTKTYNLVKYTKNLIVFDNACKQYILPYCDNANVIEIALPSKINAIALKDLNAKKPQRIMFLGRIAKEKNIDLLIGINKSLHLIDFYGQAWDDYGKKYLQILIKNNWYKGFINDKKTLIVTLKQYKFMILYSKYEGFPFSLVEALSQGVPIIVKDTFLSASYLCNSKTGLLLPKNTSVEEDIQLIKKFISMSDEQYHQYQINCINFYNENLNMEIFTNKWRKIFDQYLDKKE